MSIISLNNSINKPNYKQLIYDKIQMILETTTNTSTLELLYNKICDVEDNEAQNNLYNNIIKNFISENMIYYISTTDLYIHYLNNNFTIVSINDILHFILNKLTETHHFTTNIKYNVKSKILKKIKENSIINNIPNTETLQTILNYLYPNLFTSRNYAKYFLVTLGDILLRKTDCIYFINSSLKSFIQKINTTYSMYFNTINLFNSYKFKYSEHDTEKCRIIKTNNINLDYFKPDENFFINLICVSMHYSNRYKNGDQYLSELINSNIKNDILMIKNTSKDSMIQQFTNKYLYEREGEKIQEKDMIFLWKSYLKTNGIINVFKKNTDIIEYISKNISFENGAFINIASMHLPFVDLFKEFWNENITDDKTSYGYEISELYILFIEKYGMSSITEQNIIDIIQFYYSNYSIIDKKRIFGISFNKLWNKNNEIETFLFTKNNYLNSMDVNELYSEYCEYYDNVKIVSKQYFIHYYHYLRELIIK
jgi:hypothetical protein